MKTGELPNVVVLAGGVGGAKMADGFAQILPPGKLRVVGNTGDDFQHLGLTICPDLDTVMYTLAGVANPDTGWGRAGESWRTLDEMARLDGPDWFRLGDLDLAVHLLRSGMLQEGTSLTQVTQSLCTRLGASPILLPMTNAPAPTLLVTDQGVLPFQTWFVEQQWQPSVREVRLPEDVRATPDVLYALEKADIVVLAPSNPFVSLNPILNVYPIREMVADLPEFVVAVSPIVGGKAVKGPAAKMMSEMGMEVSAAAVADYYEDLIDIFVFDQQDRDEVRGADKPHLCVNTMMRSQSDRRELAQTILDYITEL